MGKVERGKWTASGIIVTVYEESGTVRSQHSRIPKMRAKNSHHRRFSGGGYDRRADLLAYTHYLRNAGPQQYSMPANPMHKAKKQKRLLAPLGKLGHSVSRLFGGKKAAWRYEKIETEDEEEKCRACRPGKNAWTKMSKSIGSFFKGFSSSLKCNK